MTGRIHIRSILSTAALLAVVCAVVIVAPLVQTSLRDAREQRVLRPNPVRATVEEQTAILTAVFAQETFEGPPPPPPEPGEVMPSPVKPSIVMSTESVALCRPDRELKGRKEACAEPWIEETLLWSGMDQTIPRKLRQELLLDSRASEPMPAMRSVATSIDEQEFNALSAKNQGTAWDAFYRHYPTSGGWTKASWAVVTPERQKALVYISHRCGGTCGKGWLYYLERSDRGWKIIAKEMLWIS